MAASPDVSVRHPDLSDLFKRYPDINFDAPEDFAASPAMNDHHFSSPCSDTTDHEATPAKNSTSTAHTTPLHHMSCASATSDLLAVDEVLDMLDNTDLPLESKQGFERLAQSVAVLGSFFIPDPNDKYEGFVHLNKQEITRYGQSIVAQLQQSNNKVRDNIDNIGMLTACAPFTVRPAIEDLWCIYRQRAKLITQHLAIPSRQEKDMLEHLTHIVDGYVYSPFLVLLSLEEVDVKIEDTINELYDTLMTLLHNYNVWMRKMREVKENYTQPLIRKIRKSPEILLEIAGAESIKKIAVDSIGSPDIPGTQPADERLIQELNLTTSRRRHPVPRRARSRFRREHTV